MKGLYLPAPPPVFILPGHQCLAQHPSATPHHHHHPPAGQPDIFDYGNEFQSNSEVVSPSGPEEIKISYCACTPAPVHLLKGGLFACSPVTPTLAVDLCVLEFMRTLFVWLTPNTTTQCEALESFLDVQGYQLQSKDNLQQQFSNAYHWYTVLTTYVDDHITGLVHPPPPQASVQQRVRLQSSEYLCAHCPLCFGGRVSQWQAYWCLILAFGNCSLDCINCATHDPPNPTSTVFIPESEVKAMEMFIEKHFEDGMRVPMFVLDGCGDSFHAADEKWKKASTNFSADTGLMALLCHHDHVLWLVNMTSAGEKQHYALVLLKYLFEHLPTATTVGLLYDIGCQLECNYHKWKLLDEGILSRLKFGISVFHAYGHQWPCQIYHQRLFVFDNQICHFDRKAFAALGQWLNKKWTLCKSKKMLALESLHALHIDMQTLQEEWAAQVHSQTQPLPCHAKLLAHILSLEKSVQDYQSHVDQLEMDLVNDHVNDIIDFDLQCTAAKNLLPKATKALQQKKSALGVSAQTDLYLLRHNKECLQQCKFELECLEGSSRNSANDNHLQSHVQSAIKQREPAISQLITTYNNLCDELSGMIWLQKAPPGAILHLSIPTKGIFQLDVDSDIWQDCEPGEGSSEPPQWLADDAVHKGIRLMRLSREQSVLQEWFSMEWKSLHRALENEVAYY
ncbi:hypothetical protein F5141DRAFT_1186285 [Pisolithus sp. B1]|nr:hypothetical protein F5141DRAFT_1186285 [Pisolithus sp. B1]